jgi:mono/diheme cytochrome c family protein
MTRCADLLLLSLALWPQAAAAQEQTLSPKETAGQALFAQHCVVCHLRTQLTSPGHYGPPLSKATLGGDESPIREHITEGTRRWRVCNFDDWNIRPTPVFLSISRI